MKKTVGFILALCLSVSMTACSSQPKSEVATSETNGITAAASETQTEQADDSEEIEIPEDNSDVNADGQKTETDSVQKEETNSNILVAYFSCTGNTEGVAEYIANILDADAYEIVPEEPYTSADLNYNDSSTRATIEQNDASARPTISSSVENMEDYDTVFIGYPIWWGQAPKIIYTFVESYDFSNRTIVPFCTSGSSGVGSSADNLHSSAFGANWLDGTRFSSDTSQSEIEEWINGLDISVN